MAFTNRTKISEYDATAANNINLGTAASPAARLGEKGVNLDGEATRPSDVNNAIRELMAHLKTYDADVAKLNAAQSFTAAQRGAAQTANATGSVVYDFDTYQHFVLTLTGNLTLSNPTTEVVGQSGFFVFIQDATGSRTVSLGSEFLTAGGSGLTLSTAANSVDIVPYVVQATGKILLGTPQLAFA